MIRFSIWLLLTFTLTVFLLLPFICKRVAPSARDRLNYCFTEEGYNLFHKLPHCENGLIQSLIDLMKFEYDELQVSSCKLLFAIFSAEKTLFSKAKSSYIYTENSHNIQDRMVNLAVFADADKLLLMMLQGHAESGKECIHMPFFSFSNQILFFSCRGNLAQSNRNPRWTCRGFYREWKRHSTEYHQPEHCL